MRASFFKETHPILAVIISYRYFCLNVKSKTTTLNLYQANAKFFGAICVKIVMAKKGRATQEKEDVI